MVGITVRALCVFFITSCVALAQAEEFLGSRTQAVQLKFHNQLRTLLGQGDAASIARLERLQSEIKPLYSAMPKLIDGSLDQGATRYVLHRFFVQKHGWHVRGLEITGAEKWSDPVSTTAMLEDRIPGYILELFTKSHDGQVGLRELAVLAATLEDVVHSDAVQLLSIVFASLGKTEEVNLTGSAGQSIIETYLLFHIMPNDKYKELGPVGLKYLVGQADKFYTGWLDTIAWVHDLEEFIDYDESFRRNPFVGRVETEGKRRDFSSIVRLVERMGEAYGQYQNLECRELKNALLDLSDGSGRVRFGKFYEAAFAGQTSHFTESPEYLRHLGLLDDTDPQHPSVLVANYLYARANCMAASGLYSICCIDECEALLSHVEKNISEPLGDPHTIAGIVSAMPSETVAAPRNLSEPMRRRLDEIAQRHGGLVPLHGRLFAQWMHHAFPNECRYPQVTGSMETPMTPLEWLEGGEATGRLLKASRDQMKGYVEASNRSRALDAREEPSLIPWTDEEELAVALRPVRPGGGAIWWLRLFALTLVISSVVVGLVRMLSEAVPVCSAAVGKSGSWAPVVAGAPRKAEKKHWV